MREIVLTQGKVSLVDDDVFHEINKVKWHAEKSGPNFYAKRSLPRDVDGRQRTERMHRKILNAPDKAQVDHINGNTLDNRRENLRIVTSRQNCQNRHNQKSSIYPGVNWFSRDNNWCAHITLNGKSKYLGYFDNEIDAFKAYLVACVKSGFSINFLLQKYQIEMEEINKCSTNVCSSADSLRTQSYAIQQMAMQHVPLL